MVRSILSTPFRYFEADKGANPAGGTSGAEGTNGDATGQDSTANGGTEKKLTLAELLKQHGLQGEFDTVIQGRLEREKQQREAAAEKARKEQEAKTLEEQGNFKTLADQRAAELAAATAKLEAAKATEKSAERYQAALKSHVESLLKDAPAHLTQLLAKLDPAEQLEWITTNPEALKPQAATQQKPPARGTPGAQGRTQPAGQGQQGQQTQTVTAPRRSTL